MKTKKIAVILLLGMLFAMLCPNAAFAEHHVVANGHSVSMDVIVVDGYSMAPVRPLAKLMELDLYYEADKGAILLSEKNGSVSILTREGKYKAHVNAPGTQYDLNVGAYEEMLVPCIIRDGSTYVPVRFICNVFGASVRAQGDLIFIGKLYSAEGNSADKLEKMTIQKPADYSWVVGLLIMLFVGYKTLKWWRNRPITPFDRNLRLPVNSTKRSIRLYDGERSLFEGEAFYCRTEHMVVGENQHGVAMAMPDSDFLYHPVHLQVDYRYGNVIVFNRGTLVITTDRMVFLNGNRPFELYNDSVVRMEIYADGFAFMAQGEYYFMRVAGVDMLAAAIYNAFGDNSCGVQDHRHERNSRLFPKNKNKVEWLDGDQ